MTIEPIEPKPMLILPLEPGGALGMSLRDYFAGQVLGTMAMHTGVLRHAAVEEAIHEMARACYRVADSMLKARDDGP